MEFELRPVKPEAYESCLKKVGEYMERNLSRELGRKTDYGRTRAELGYQRIAASVSGQIAGELGCSEAGARVVSMAAGLYFPKYGQEGLKAVKQYIIDRGIDLDPETLGLAVACYYVSEYRFRYPKPTALEAYYGLFLDYFTGKDTLPESRIVRLVQQTILDVKKAEAFCRGLPGDLLYDATKELVALAREHKTLVKGTFLEPYREQIAQYRFPQLPEQTRREIYDRLDRLIGEFANYPEHLAHWNKPPEEVVLHYIVSGILCED